MSLNKWNIPDEKFIFESISNRFNMMDESIISYLKEDTTEENLHKVRINLRRLRYTLEVFSSFFKDDEWYEIFYKNVSKLQDITGRARDLDVIKEYLSNKNLPQEESIENDKNRLKNKAIKKLEDFINTKNYIKFKKFFGTKKED